MTIVPAIGSTRLGIVVGWLIRYFLRRFRPFNPKILGSIVGIMLGGTVVGFLETDESVS
jgi:hypothetical protein